MRILLLFLLASTTVSAEAELPPILDFYPECYAETPSSLTFTSDKIVTKHKLINLETDPRYAEILKQLQAKAASQNAQALTIEKVEKIEKIQNTTGALRPKAPYSLEVKITAKLVSFCSNNTALGMQQPPYNAQGHKINVISRVMSSDTTIIFAKPPEDAVYKTPENYVVSLDQGVAGVKPGQTRSVVNSLLGDPSVKIQLQDGELWSYGRTLWLKFAEQLQWVSTNPELMSTEGFNTIDIVDAYDNSLWSIEGEVTLKTPLTELEQKLPSQFRQTDEQQFVKKNKQFNLVLDYRKSKKYHIDPSRTILSDFTLAKGDKTIAKVPSYPATALAAWLQQAVKTPDISINTLQNQIPLHQFDRGTKGSWVAAGNYLLLQYKDNRLTKVLIADSLFKQKTDTTEFLQLVNAAAIPATRAQFMAKYPDAIESGYDLTFYQGARSVVASFNSEDKDAQIERLELTLI